MTSSFEQTMSRRAEVGNLATKIIITFIVTFFRTNNDINP